MEIYDQHVLIHNLFKNVQQYKNENVKVKELELPCTMSLIFVLLGPASLS
jgi:hypothetical protein